jgi:hypothetical protein
MRRLAADPGDCIWLATVITPAGRKFKSFGISFQSVVLGAQCHLQVHFVIRFCKLAFSRQPHVETSKRWRMLRAPAVRIAAALTAAANAADPSLSRALLPPMSWGGLAAMGVE